MCTWRYWGDFVLSKQPGRTGLLPLELLAAHEGANFMQRRAAVEVKGHRYARPILHGSAGVKKMVDVKAAVTIEIAVR